MAGDGTPVTPPPRAERASRQRFVTTRGTVRVS
jgi:hypothetical protein